MASPSRNAAAQARAAMTVMKRRVDGEANMCSDTVANTCSVVKRRTLRTVELAFAHRSLALEGPPRIMAIVNVTPDSFYDRGLTADPAAAVARGLEMVAAGADLLDIGGMTAQPGDPIPVAAKIDRVVPVVRALRARLDVPIAVDTYRAEVAAAALAAGADLVNDHTGLSDPELAEAVAAGGAGLVVTHLGIAPKEEQ